MIQLHLPDGPLEYWGARDGLVLKAIALVLGEYLLQEISAHCYHIAGHGGAMQAVRDVFAHLDPDAHIMKSDVKSYYASIDHAILFDQLTACVPDPFVLRLLWQYMKRTVCFGETYRDVTRGISLGCPLSPLMGALYLKPLDDWMQEAGLFYVRFMDDWAVVAPSRWKLRKAVREVNKVLKVLRLEQHPRKTFIGRACRGIDFLGYRLSPVVLTVAASTVYRFRQRRARLYEQGAERVRIGQYVLRWLRWLKGGIGHRDCLISIARMSPFPE